MPDIQEETTKEIFATIKEGVQFGVKELKEALEWILASLSKQKEQIAGHYNRHEDRQEYRHEDEFRSNKVSMKELAETGGALDKTTIFDHDKLFDEVMAEYGIKYSVKERPLLDENGKQKLDYSKCKFEMEEDGKTPKMDYSKCNMEIDPETKEPKLDKEGKPILKPDSPEPTPKLAKGSPQPMPMKEYMVFYEARNAEVMNEAYKDYQIKREQTINQERAKEVKKEEKQQKKQEKKEEKLDKKMDKTIAGEKEKYETPIKGKDFEEKHGAENVEKMEITKPQRFKDLAEKNGITNYAMDVTKGKNGLKYTVTYNKKDKEKMELIGNTSRANNVKKMISKNDKRKESINKPSPEKHHNRGAQSL